MSYFDRKLSEPIQCEDALINKAIRIDQNNWTPSLTDKQLSDIFDKGSSLNIYLRPSDQILSRKGTEGILKITLSQ